jgi:hypothetical protein
MIVNNELLSKVGIENTKDEELAKSLIGATPLYHRNLRLTFVLSPSYPKRHCNSLAYARDLHLGVNMLLRSGPLIVRHKSDSAPANRFPLDDHTALFRTLSMKRRSECIQRCAECRAELRRALFMQPASCRANS